VPLSVGGARSPSNTKSPGPRPNLPTKWHLDPSSSLATIDMGQKVGAAVPLSMGELGPHLTKCHLGQGLPPYQVASSSIQPFHHNRHGLQVIRAQVKLASVNCESTGGCCAPFHDGSWSPSNAMWLGPRPTYIPSGIVIHPTVWPQYTNVTDRTDRQRSDSIG